jgi:hypothetical protein
LTVTDDLPEEKLYTATELLDIVLAAYERGLTEGRVAAGRDRWRNPAVADSFRAARVRVEVAEMKRRAVRHRGARGYPTGYDYRGGAVDWETGMPAGSACAWLRRRRVRSGFDLAGTTR